MPGMENHLYGPGHRLRTGRGWLDSDGEQASGGQTQEMCGNCVWTCHQRGHSYLVTSPSFLKKTRHVLFIPMVTISGGIQFPLCFQSRFQWFKPPLSLPKILRLLWGLERTLNHSNIIFQLIPWDNCVSDGPLNSGSQNVVLKPSAAVEILGKMQMLRPHWRPVKKGWIEGKEPMLSESTLIYKLSRSFSMSSTYVSLARIVTYGHYSLQGRLEMQLFSWAHKHLTNCPNKPGFGL